MTKRNLLLVSLFLVFGLVGMATSALAQTQWTFGTNVRIGGRPEGEKEATGQVTRARVRSNQQRRSRYRVYNLL